MMSINEIKNYSFKLQRGNSYKASEVDSFMAEVKTTLDALTQAYEKAKKDNDELYRKMNVLADKIEEYRKDEDSIRAALITAQRMAESVIAEAKSQAQTLVDEAQAKADSVIGSIKGETDDYVITQKNDADVYAAKLKAEADKYYAEKTAQADEILSKAQKECDKLTSSAQAKAKAIAEKAENEAARVISDCEEKKAEMIAKANTQADEIVTNTQARIENSQKKLDELKAMTAQFKAGVAEVLKKELELLDEIKVSDSDYSAEYYPTEFSIDSGAIYRPELTIDEENTEDVEEFVEEDVQIADADVEEQTQPETEIVSEETTEEVAEISEEDEITEIEEIEIEDEDIVVDISEEKTEDEAKTEKENNAVPEADYYELLMKELAEEKESNLSALGEIDDSDDSDAVVIEQEKPETTQNESRTDTRNVFTKLDLEEGLDNDDTFEEISSSTRVDLSELDAKQLRFGTNYDIFDEEEETQGSFFSKFKKK